MLAQLPPALQNLQLPLRLRLWDGHEFNLGPTPSVTIVVKDPQMVTQFTHPSLDALGAAFVEGKLELEGSISEVIRVCDELSNALLDEDEDSQPVRAQHDKDTDAKAISYHYDLSNAFYQLPVPISKPAAKPSNRLSKPNSAICAASCACSRANICWMSVVVGVVWRDMRRESLA
jgi:hypothetical protein